MTKIRLCSSRKFGYLRREDAISELRSLQSVPPQYHKHGHAPKRAYLCSCGLYHLTSKRGSKKP